MGMAPGAVQLLLRNIDSRTTVVQAELDDTVESVLERLGNGKANLRVEYAGRCLPLDATIGELGLPRDATLHVNSRLLSTPHPDAWNLAEQVVAAAGQQPGSAASVDELVWNFLNVARAARERRSAGPLGPVADHVSIFLRSGAPGALAQLYLYSQDESCRAEAERAIRRFLTEQSGVLKVWTAPVLLELSGSIANGTEARQRRVDDPLYADLRRALADVIADPEWNPACWLDASLKLVAEQLTRFAVETASAVTEQITGAYLMLAAGKRNLAEFRTFSAALRRQARLDAGDAPPRLRPWWAAMYEALVSLLRSVIEYMAMIDAFLLRRKDAASSSSGCTASLPCVWVVLAELDAWSGVADLPEIRNAVRATLAVHAAATGVLVLSAGTTEWCQDIGWIIPRHRDLLDLESRRHLAMTMLPKLAAAAPDTAPMLIDRSRLLADSFGYIAHATPEELCSELKVEFTNEMATGPGVRREWFCMVFQALFDPSQVLFSACPSDRRRFFVNPNFNQMLAGINDTIDVKEWKAHTDYHGYRRKSHRVEWFWKAVEAMTVEQRRRLLFFWTSVEYLPFDGFSGLGSRLSIFRSHNSCDHLPTSGTCFYQLHLPAYTSYNMMQGRLQMIVQEHVSSSFGKS
ncbi:hypothetical protein PR202_gb02745 [Eleusine coracana subsp. coracana]|uniref:HECT-type E3 ubiquitin transferase n=1 Tax=Eleusine coracana subsp. coracana TaxID=191504 RepID=A0AAV5DZY4_ELECO|nr:hypothetical protein PR202_gb02745 [Eleusine coracana subsp. coracana]